MMSIAVLSLRMTSMCDPGKKTPRAKTSSGGGEGGGGRDMCNVYCFRRKHC